MLRAMLNTMATNEELLRAMEEYCARHQTNLTQLSIDCGNRAIATRLKLGRSINAATYNRLVKTLNGETNGEEKE